MPKMSIQVFKLDYEWSGETGGRNNNHDPPPPRPPPPATKARHEDSDGESETSWSPSSVSSPPTDWTDDELVAPAPPRPLSTTTPTWNSLHADMLACDAKGNTKTTKGKKAKKEKDDKKSKKCKKTKKTKKDKKCRHS